MITSVFSKSRPLNYIIISALLVICYFLYLQKAPELVDSVNGIMTRTGLLLLLIGSLFIINFVTKKNGLSKDNSYTFLFFFSFLILFPTTLVNTNLIISNFFILLALRRLISLQSLLTPKEKIFDASLWIFLAAIFHFWSILFILIVFVSILFHVSRDYRNWVLPFISFFAVGVIALMYALIFDQSLIETIVDSALIDFNFNYFTNNYQNFALSLYLVTATFFFITQALTLPNKPLNMQSSYKKIIVAFIIGAVVFLISSDKNNSLLIYTFAPVAIMATNHIESMQVNWLKETFVYVIVGCSVLTFFSQL
ncbi:hypothetical protein CLV94_1465 [Flavobacterium endophyticum]|uniref:Uncharacterized protein n=1 Tax=Flavobacterium endophyticum TaxID=1540163 RepID=A0A495MKD2_9FLAO|nr:DUF6427 family protein [Flavobacterium endophyticum]RKS26407.1 hypothetical protein CLV94_1465 [Flavobacterium endophyticum]